MWCCPWELAEAETSPRKQRSGMNIPDQPCVRRGYLSPSKPFSRCLSGFVALSMTGEGGDISVETTVGDEYPRPTERCWAGSAAIPMAIGTVMEVASFLSFFDVSLMIGTRKNADLDQNNRRLSARSVFFRVRSTLAMEHHVVTLQFSLRLRWRGWRLSCPNGY